MIAGTVTSNNLALRCPFCGDSETSPNRAHFSVNLTSGLFHCFRCQASGKLTTGQLLELHHRGSTNWERRVSTDSNSYDSLVTRLELGPLEHSRSSRLP